MRSSFWHVGINKHMEDNEEGRAPRIQPNGSIERILLPDHADPDYNNLTYGEPMGRGWGRLGNLENGDIAFLIESATGDEWKTWSYYVVAIYVTEEVYHFDHGSWVPHAPQGKHLERISYNAHFLDSEEDYYVLLGEKERSRVMFDKPFRLSEKQDPLKSAKLALKLNQNKHYVSYWYHHWFENEETEDLLELIGKS